MPYCLRVCEIFASLRLKLKLPAGGGGEGELLSSFVLPVIRREDARPRGAAPPLQDVTLQHLIQPGYQRPVACLLHSSRRIKDRATGARGGGSKALSWPKFYLSRNASDNEQPQTLHNTAVHLMGSGTLPRNGRYTPDIAAVRADIGCCSRRWPRLGPARIKVQKKTFITAIGKQRMLIKIGGELKFAVNIS